MENNVKKQVAEVFAEGQDLATATMSQKTRTKKSGYTPQGAVIDSRTNRAVAVAVLDSVLRGFKQNCRAIYQNRTNTAVARLLAEKGIKPALFSDYKKLAEYVKKYGGRYIDGNDKICHEKVAKSATADRVELHTALGHTIRWNDDRTKAVALVPAFAWSVSQFVNMVAHCAKEERKQNNIKPDQADGKTAQAYLYQCLAQVK